MWLPRTVVTNAECTKIFLEILLDNKKLKKLRLLYTFTKKKKKLQNVPFYLFFFLFYFFLEAALVSISIRDFFQKHEKSDPKLLGVTIIVTV